ncbi:hypothetical protein X808_6200 [Mannheimia varigena USDA-ARS-USMARC-1296]|uniref:Uncharacterized protein n=1 Tax=Mannheimia varigena USDA-ARS-USMARC-1296 TaxID=1433287 RepID=W0QD24_9PAST|nr:hypothetical protein X808_6200 [Mannheimia varigena USDA-ARS-USMARC-1296]
MLVLFLLDDLALIVKNYAFLTACKSKKLFEYAFKQLYLLLRSTVN